MRCTNCEQEFDEKLGDCPHCGAVPEMNAQILEDKEEYTGITIDQDGNEDTKENYYNQQQNPYSNVYVKRINFPSGIIAQIITLIVIAIIIFVLLPAFLVGFLVVAAIWFVYRLLFH